MERISVFDMLKIGIGPSSSHTLGPWRAAESFIKELKNKDLLYKTEGVCVNLYGSLSLTGKGHATDLAVMLGLSGADPEYVPIESLDVIITAINNNKEIYLANERIIKFNPLENIIFNKNFLPFHANGISFTAFGDDFEYTSTYYSIGGGFIIKEEDEKEDKEDISTKKFPFPIDKATELLDYCRNENKKISEIVFENEKSLRSESEIHNELLRIWNTMLECAYIGCHTEGVLPGELNVRRRAYDIHKHLIGVVTYNNPTSWLTSIKKTDVKFREILKWVSCFSLAVNEVNASLGRVVTAPTNGSAGVIPAVLLYYITIENHNATDEQPRAHPSPRTNSRC